MIAVGRTSQEDYRRKDWHSRASRALVCGLGGVVAFAGDPAPLAMPPRRGFGGDGARCRLSEKRTPDMPSRKTVKTAKARPGGKRPATKTPHPKAARVATPRATSKQATVIALL